jgi:tagatose-1,6-bisphosphate aldolase
MPSLSAPPLGKLRRLRQAAGPGGTFGVLAIDHRGPLRRRLAQEPAAAGLDLDAALSELKQDIVAALAPESSAVLLDPETGVGPCVEGGALPGDRGLLVALDTGSTGDPAALRTGLVPGWSAERIARSGASGLKLLVYYHPAAPEAADVEVLVREIGAACAAVELPFYLEPLSYRPGDMARPLTSAERWPVVVETARRLVPLGVDVLKAEFPVNPVETPDEGLWREACAELTEASIVPWVLLSAGAGYEVFLRQARVSGEAGASGVIAGRALWNEAVTLDRPARLAFLAGPGRDRMRRTREVCEASARPHPALVRKG